MSEQTPATAAGSEGTEMDVAEKDWAELTWQERRRIRLQRWQDAPEIQFESEAARATYRSRVQLVIDAIHLRKPARVPTCPEVALYLARYGGLTARDAMFDFKKLSPVWQRFHEDFMPDFQAEAVWVGKPSVLIGKKDEMFPGHGVSDDDPYQYVEAEYMKEDEYDALLADPSGYLTQTYLPRVADVFEPLVGLGTGMDLALGLPFSLATLVDPAAQDALRRMTAAAEALAEYFDAYAEMTGEVAATLGIPNLWGPGAYAPYDMLGDTLRGTKGIMIDRFRQPEKILAAIERLTPLYIASLLRQMPESGSPIVFFALHKGADGFMSDADFRTFYWPSLKRVMKAVIDEGFVPMCFAEGGFNSRLSAIADPDLPSGSVIWWFDRTDMVAAKQALGGYACIAGNVPATLIAVGSAREVEEYVTNLLDAVAGDGGFILVTGAGLDIAKPENLRAMIETGRAWRG